VARPDHPLPLPLDTRPRAPAAAQVQEEERHHNQHNIVTLLSDSVSGAVIFSMLLQPTDGRNALFSTMSRLFEGLSDIAKAVLIILIADTMLGYHSEEVRR
jgi:hypothetical protein